MKFALQPGNELQKTVQEDSAQSDVNWIVLNHGFTYFNIYTFEVIFRTEMNRTYIFDVIDRHSVKSIELYEFQVFLRLRL